MGGLFKIITSLLIALGISGGAASMSEVTPQEATDAFLKDLSGGNQQTTMEYMDNRYVNFLENVKGTDEEMDRLEDALFKKEVICNRLNFLSIDGLAPGEELRVRAKIRYHHKPQAAKISMVDEDRLKICFDEPVRAVTPGQSAVFYDDDDCVVGGGVICNDR